MTTLNMTETTGLEVLTDRGLLQVAGVDARTFLQGLITNDIERVGDEQAIHTGLLSPQGKILFEFLVSRDRRGPADGSDAYLIDVRAADLADLAKRLTFYRLRAKVTITDFSTRIKVAVDPSRRHGLADPRSGELPYRSIVAADAPIASETGFHRCRIQAGVPELGKDFAGNEVFPHEALFDQMGSVDFHKGCYVGQEVVSRTQHRGTARSRFLIVEAGAELPATETSITAAGQPIATLASRCGTHGLALTRIDRLRRALDAGGSPEIAGIPLTFSKPAFASFDLSAPALPSEEAQ